MSLVNDWSSKGKFGRRYAGALPEAQLRMEKAALGIAVGARGYTTLAQARRLVKELSLGPDSLLLDVGSGRGWPGLFLAQASGCRALLVDLPQEALATAAARAAALNVDARFFRASATHLPVRPMSLDAVVHTDVL